jgi:MFS family permease
MRDRSRTSVLRIPGIRRLTLALVLSNSADQFALLALMWFILQQTNSAAMMGIVVTCVTAPALITSPWAGVLLDRWRPQRLIALDNLARCACLTSVPLLYGLHVLNLPAILVVAVVTGMLTPLTYSGTRVLVPQLVPAHALPAANGFLSIGDQIPYLLGPATAGVVVARVGGPVALLVPAAVFAVVAVLIRRVPASRDSAAGRDPEPSRIRDGMAPLWRVPALRALLILTLTYYFAYGPLEPALPMYVREHLHAGAGAYGLLWGSFGIGALAGLILVKPLSRFRPGIVNAGGAIAWGVIVAPMALVHHLWTAMLLFGAGAFVWAPYSAVEMSVIQRLVPPAQHGVVIGTRRALLVAAAPAGAALGGAVTTPHTTGAVLAISALACVLAGLACLRSPHLRSVPPTSDKDELGHRPTADHAAHHRTSRFKQIRSKSRALTVGHKR